MTTDRHTERAELLAHLDALALAGCPAVCRSVPIADRGLWTSDDPGDQRVAARLCAPCPAVTPCREYGLDHQRDAGAYGGPTETERRKAAREQGGRMTTTDSTHRPGCTRPGWTVEPSQAVRGVSIARCLGCGCVELRTGADR